MIKFYRQRSVFVSTEIPIENKIIGGGGAPISVKETDAERNSVILLFVRFVLLSARTAKQKA